MRNTRNCTRLQLVRALALMMCLLLGGLAEADDLAADLGGDYGAAGQPNDIASDLGDGFQGAEPFNDVASDLGGDFQATEPSNDVATDLGGGFQATDPTVQQQEPLLPQVNMTDADLSIGYVEPGYLTYSPVATDIWSMISCNQLVFESVVDLDDWPTTGCRTVKTGYSTCAAAYSFTMATS